MVPGCSGAVVFGFGTGFFFTGAFFGAGSVSSTTVFFGGVAARAFCSATRSWLTSVSFAFASLSMRSANARRELSTALRSLFNS